MNRTFLVVGLLLAGCGGGPAFLGTFDGQAQLTADSRTVKHEGSTTVAVAGSDYTVTIALPLPTQDATPPTTTCVFPAKAGATNELLLQATDCPAVTVADPCVMTLKLAEGKAEFVATNLTVTGSGTVLGAHCGQGGADVTNAFTFTAPYTR